MRIVHVIPGLGVGGGAEQSFVLGAGAIVEAGHQLHVVLLTDRRGFVPELERLGVVVHDLSVPGTLRRAVGIRRVVRAVEPDLVHATLFDADVPVQILARHLGIPVLVTWPATPYSEERRLEPGVTWWKLQAVRNLESVLARWSGCHFQAVTPGVAAENARALRVDADRVTVAERGRPAPPAPDPRRRAATREALGVGGDDPLVLAIARHEPQKGPHRLVAALDHLVELLPDVRVVVAGREGSSTATLREQLATRRHADRLQLLGHRDDVPRLLEAADVVVSCSLNEGAAGAVIEAMAAGVPVVASPVVGLTGVLEDGRNARVVDAGDPVALATAVAEVLSDPEVADRLREGGRRTWESRFTTGRSAEALIALYERLIRDAATRRS